MKLLILSFLFSTNLLAQPMPNSNINNETNLNNTLMQNAAQQQQYQQQTGGSGTRPSIDPSGGVNGNGATNLTDQEKQLSENYIDQAKANQVIKDKCKGDMEQACAGQQINFKTSTGVDAKTGEFVAKAYATIGGMLDSKLKMKPTEAKAGDVKPDAAAAGDGKEASKEEADNCKMIPAATETLAQFMQQQNADFNQAASKTQQSDLAQKDALLKAAMSHDKRSENAQIQAYGWFGGAACYSYMLIGGGAALDWKIGLKLGATVFLGMFYQDEVDKYKEYANKTRAIANALPGKGDCNPITQKVCYCGTEAHKTDPQYAQYCNPPGLHTNPIAAGNFRVACTDNTMKLDPNCNCTKTNSCFDQAIAAKSFGNALGIGSLAGSPLSPIRSLSRGELVGANVSGGINGSSLALAKNAMGKLASALSGNSNPMNAGQLEYAKALMNKGIPGNLAQNMAQYNIPPGALNNAMAKFDGATFGTGSGATYASRSNVLDFSGGGGLGIGGRSTSSGKKGDTFTLPSKKGPSGNVLEFAAKAQAQAQSQGQIRKSDASLFEVISNRYQVSGRRLLELDTAQ